VRFTETPIEALKTQTQLRVDFIQKIRDALNNPAIHQLNQLASVNGIGDKTLEKAFSFMRESSVAVSPNQSTSHGQASMDF
jgi:hypothetical protein